MKLNANINILTICIEIYWSISYTSFHNPRFLFTLIHNLPWILFTLGVYISQGKEVVLFITYVIRYVWYNQTSLHAQPVIDLDLVAIGWRHYRAVPRFAPSQWETSLQSMAVSHWLGANLESALHYIWGQHISVDQPDHLTKSNHWAICPHLPPSLESITVFLLIPFKQHIIN